MISRRAFIALACGLLVPEPRRVYSFPTIQKPERYLSFKVRVVGSGSVALSLGRRAGKTDTTRAIVEAFAQRALMSPEVRPH